MLYTQGRDGREGSDVLRGMCFRKPNEKYGIERKMIDWRNLYRQARLLLERKLLLECISVLSSARLNFIPTGIARFIRDPDKPLRCCTITSNSAALTLRVLN